MLPFRDYPIRRKLTTFVLLVSCLALLAAVFAVAGYQRILLKRQAIRDLKSRAEMIAASTSGALNLGEPKIGQETLNTLESSGEIVAACIYDRRGEVFASYVRPQFAPISFPSPEPDGPQFHGSELRFFNKIYDRNNEFVGTVFLEYSLSQAQARTRADALISIVIIAALVGLSFILSTVLQRTISAPIMRLAAAAQAITARGDYGLRVPKETNDEIGQLTDAFNQMLAIIAARKEDLEKRVAERTHELDESNRRLQEHIGELQHISYSLTHDMRGPVRAMHNFAQLLRDEFGTGLSHAGHEYLQRILDASTRLDHLIQDAFAYTNVAEPSPVKLRAIDTGAFLRSMIATYPEFHEGAHVELDRDLPVVLGNEAFLTQCFSNLLGNAVKFKVPGTDAQVKVRAEGRNSSVRFWVEDQGIGIPKAAQDRIFGMFQRAHVGYEGTGIGLAIVRKAVERMGGRVGVESEPGRGSRFWVELQPAKAEAGANGGEGI